LQDDYVDSFDKQHKITMKENSAFNKMLDSLKKQR